MRLQISCDMDGISGIVDWERGCELISGDANAAINGAFVGEIGLNAGAPYHAPN